MPFHGGFGLLNLHGIPKPTYRAYELLHRLGSDMLVVDGSHETVDAWAVRKGNRSTTILLTNHALPCHPIAAQAVHVTLTHAPPVGSAFVERIDGAHAHAKRAWTEMGEPEYLKGAEVERLKEASRIGKEPQSWEYAERTVHLDVELPAHAVAAVTLEFAADEGRDGAPARASLR